MFSALAVGFWDESTNIAKYHCKVAKVDDEKNLQLKTLVTKYL